MTMGGGAGEVVIMAFNRQGGEKGQFPKRQTTCGRIRSEDNVIIENVFIETTVDTT